MSSVNKAILVGNLCADVESKTFQNGGKIASLRIATNEKWKSKEGEQKERVEYHSVTLNSDGLVNVAERYLRKGSKVYIEGKLQTRKWQDQSGNDRYTTEIVVGGFDGKLVMLDGAKGGGTRQTGSATSSDTGFGGGDFGAGDLDDDVPFISSNPRFERAVF